MVPFYLSLHVLLHMCLSVHLPCWVYNCNGITHYVGDQSAAAHPLRFADYVDCLDIVLVQEAFDVKDPLSQVVHLTHCTACVAAAVLCRPGMVGSSLQCYHIVS